MEKVSLQAIARSLGKVASQSPSGRSAETVFGGHEKGMRQTVIALTEGQTLAPHENPGEATVLVLSGRVRMSTDETSWEGREGDFLVVPHATHDLHAVSDASVLLTVGKVS